MPDATTFQTKIQESTRLSKPRLVHWRFPKQICNDLLFPNLRFRVKKSSNKWYRCRTTYTFLTITSTTSGREVKPTFPKIPNKFHFEWATGTNQKVSQYQYLKNNNLVSTPGWDILLHLLSHTRGKSHLSECSRWLTYLLCKNDLEFTRNLLRYNINMRTIKNQGFHSQKYGSVKFHIFGVKNSQYQKHPLNHCKHT